jgi:hypothetical protein
LEGERKSLKGDPPTRVEPTVLLRFINFSLDHKDCFGYSSVISVERGVRCIENGNRGFGSLNSGPKCGVVGVEGEEPNFLDLKVADFSFGGAEKRTVEECFMERTIVVLGVGEWERMNLDNGETAASKF